MESIMCRDYLSSREVNDEIVEGCLAEMKHLSTDGALVSVFDETRLLIILLPSKATCCNNDNSACANPQSCNLIGQKCKRMRWRH